MNWVLIQHNTTGQKEDPQCFINCQRSCIRYWNTTWLLVIPQYFGPRIALRDAANKVGKGDLTQRVINNSGDEIGELATAFNKMVTDL